MLIANYKAGSFVLDEISSQARAWLKIIPILLHQREAIRELFTGIDAVVFTGCGFALNVSFSAAPLFQMLTGISARATPAPLPACCAIHGLLPRPLIRP